MIARVRTVTPVLYVTDIAVSFAFYRLLGFEEIRHGDDGDWVWSYARCDGLGLMLARGDVDPDAKRGPVQLYCQCDDVAAIQEQLASAGVSLTHLGYPEHAPGGEIRAIDPDGYVVMIAQTTGAARVDPSPQLDNRASVLQAAEVLRRRGTPTPRCEIGGPHGQSCPQPAAVKLADTWGESAWSCLDHADEVLLSASGAYVATENGQGLTRFLARRRSIKS
jgi:hypothetical protein